MDKQCAARQVMRLMEELPQVRACRMYGSFARGGGDEYSDIDIEVDVSGCDNGRFAVELPGLLADGLDVLCCDYAPSLAPDKYVVTLMLMGDDPFGMVDVSCVAEPHCASVSRRELRALNSVYDHTLKVFAANLKHCLRGSDCADDVMRMYRRVCPEGAECDTVSMLRAVYEWLLHNAPDARKGDYAALFGRHMAGLC